MGRIPRWVELGKGAKVDRSVVFISYNDKETRIGKGAKVDSGSVIYGDVALGADAIVGHNTVVRQGTRVGVHSIVANLCMLEGNTLIGEHTLITPQNHLCQKTRIGDYVFMAPFCCTTNDPKMYYYRKGYSRETGAHWSLLEGPKIGDGARIATGVSFLPKVRVGNHAVIGAGAVVTKDIPDYVIAYGVPATVKGRINPLDDQIVKCTKNHH